MENPYIRFRYHTDGRVVENHCSVAHHYITEGLAEAVPGEDRDTYHLWLKAQGEEVPEEPTEEPTEPEVGEAPEGEMDGWPDGYSFERTGAYLAVFDPDGQPVKSETPSGKWLGEDAAQEAAWKHSRGEQ